MYTLEGYLIPFVIPAIIAGVVEAKVPHLRCWSYSGGFVLYATLAAICVAFLRYVPEPIKESGVDLQTRHCLREQEFLTNEKDAFARERHRIPGQAITEEFIAYLQKKHPDHAKELEVGCISGRSSQPYQLIIGPVGTPVLCTNPAHSPAEIELRRVKRNTYCVLHMGVVGLLGLLTGALFGAQLRRRRGASNQRINADQ